MGLTISSYLKPQEDESLVRAKVFFESYRFLDLVEEAKRKNIIIIAVDKSTIIKYVSRTTVSESETEWCWDKPDSSDVVYEILKRNIERRSNVEEIASS